MTTGQRMKLRRKELGLSAEHVADVLGVSPATVYRYENGDIEKVPGDRLVTIASALRTTPTYLMGWGDSHIEDLSHNDSCQRIVSAFIHNFPISEIDTAKTGLLSCLELSPNMKTCKRIAILFEPLFSQKELILNALQIDDDEFDDWIRYNVFPIPQTVSKLLRFFRISPTDLLDESDYAEYCKRKSNAKYYFPSDEWDTNIIRIAARDGSYEERILSDDQMAAVKAFLQLLPDAPEDL